MKALIKSFTLILVLLLAVSCTREPEIFYPLAESNGINDAELNRAVLKAAENKGILSLTVYRNSDLILEEYFGEYSSSDFYGVRSITKTVTALLFGIAFDMGLIDNLDSTVGDYLSQHLIEGTEDVAEVTIRQLLTMTGGFDWYEFGATSRYNEWVVVEDHLNYALVTPVINTPGTTFTYTTPGCTILSAIFTEATGYTLEEFAEEYLYPGLGITGERPWSSDIHGFNYGGVTLKLGASDMSKIGVMMLNMGRYNNNDIVSENWITDLSSEKIDIGNSMPYATGYGYLTWTGPSYYYANGYGGQFIVVWPSLNLVVTTQSEVANEHRSSDEQWMSTLNLIMNDIFACVQ